MEAGRPVKLTVTNSSIDLIALIYQCPSTHLFPKSAKRFSDKNMCGKTSIERPFASMCFAGLVAFGGAIRPDPIPNSAVKRSCANGTMSQDLGE